MSLSVRSTRRRAAACRLICSRSGARFDITIVFITHDLEEAIFLADRILVLSAHPGEVQELIEVPVPRPRSAAQFITPEFLSTKARLDELIHQPNPDDEEEGTFSMITRLTDVTDDVE